MNFNQSYCRLCGALKNSDDDIINLVEDSHDRDEITRKLYRINAVVDFTSNILPQTVCLVCVTNLERAFYFVSNVEKVQADLYVILSEKFKEEEDLECAEEGSIWEPEVEVQCPIDTDCDTAKLNTVAFHHHQSSSFAAFEKKEYLDVKPHSKIVKKSESPKPETSNNNRENTTKQPQQAPQLDGPWKNFKWMCHICDTEFATRKELNSHAMHFHGCCNPYRCNDCRLRVSTLQRFLMHIKKHPERKNLKYSCYICFKQYSSSKEIKTHPKEHIINAKHFCKGCHAEFNDERELEIHTNTYLKSVRKNRVQHLVGQTDGLTCLICQTTLKSNFILQRHLLTHLDREKKYTCDTCGKCFVEKRHLTSHQLIHSNERPYQCEICKASFKSSASLHNHVGSHTATTPFECNVCGRGFKQKRLLNVHRTRTHSAELPFVCQYCSKPFRRRTNLNIHLRQHTGIRPYSCSICNRDFADWGNHNKHMKTRHGIDTAKKKHTSEGTFPINTVTGSPMIPKKTEQMLEWQRQMLQPKSK